MSNDEIHGQTNSSKEKNIKFFLDGYSSYKDDIAEIDTYKKVSSAINRNLIGFNRILDIGNGGVFDYDTSLVNQIYGLDLFLNNLPKDIKLPENVTMVQGSALDIPENLVNFDGVIMVMLIHHLVGESVAACEANVRKAFSESYKVLSDGGKILVVDSFVPQWFYFIEKLIFKPASWVIERITTHPPVIQYTLKHTIKMLEESGFKDIKIEKIPMGSFILQFGIKFPSFLTPTQPSIILARK
jgi:SAM-dependent methyltransferase